MSRQSPKPCAKDGCPALVYDGGRWCDKHQPVEGKWSDPHRGSRHDRGYGTEWDKQRVRILERDSYLCQPCMRRGQVTPASEVDHIIPRAEGGSEDDANLQSICHACHRAKTQAEAARGRR